MQKYIAYIYNLHLGDKDGRVGIYIVIYISVKSVRFYHLEGVAFGGKKRGEEGDRLSFIMRVFYILGEGDDDFQWGRYI